jgi:hypothetical protein
MMEQSTEASAISRPHAFPSSLAEAGAVAVLILITQMAVLHLIGRPLLCPCATVALWHGTLDPSQNSQQISDPYSFLHVTLGLISYRWLSWIRPSWTFSRIALVILVMSATWEIVENLPIVVQLFGAPGSELHYVGDSLVNSFTDTLFVLGGATAASALTPRNTLQAVVAIELVVMSLIGDGILLGTLRLFGA